STVYGMNDSLELALHQDKMNESVFKLPEESGETTNAIPIITDDDLNRQQSDDNTIIRQDQDDTKTFSAKDQPKKGKRKKRWLKILVALFIIITVGVVEFFIFHSLF